MKRLVLKQLFLTSGDQSSRLAQSAVHDFFEGRPKNTRQLQYKWFKTEPSNYYHIMWISLREAQSNTHNITMKTISIWFSIIGIDSTAWIIHVILLKTMTCCSVYPWECFKKNWWSVLTYVAFWSAAFGVSLLLLPFSRSIFFSTAIFNLVNWRVWIWTSISSFSIEIVCVWTLPVSPESVDESRSQSRWRLPESFSLPESTVAVIRIACQVWRDRNQYLFSRLLVFLLKS